MDLHSRWEESSVGTLFAAYTAILADLASMTQGVEVSSDHTHSILNWVEDQVKASFAESRASGNDGKRTAGIAYNPAVIRVEAAPGQIRELPTIAVTISPVPKKAEGTVGVLFPGTPDSPAMFSIPESEVRKFETSSPFDSEMQEFMLPRTVVVAAWQLGVYLFNAGVARGEVSDLSNNPEARRLTVQLYRSAQQYAQWVRSRGVSQSSAIVPLNYVPAPRPAGEFDPAQWIPASMRHDSPIGRTL